MATLNKRVAGIIKRVQVARALWGDGHKEDAAALVFIATASLSRMRFPQKAGYTDRAAFTAFIRQEMATITNGTIPTPLYFPQTIKLPGIKDPKNVPLEDIFYGTWRCVMIHEAHWPDEVYLTETRAQGDYRTHIDLLPDGKLGLPEEWILGLAFAVENAVEITLTQILEFPIYCIFSGPITSLEDGSFQLKPNETKVPRLTVRNQQAIPIFTDESKMKNFIAQNSIPELAIGTLPDSIALRNFISYGTHDDRFVFNPTVGEVPLPSYSKDLLLSALP